MDKSTIKKQLKTIIEPYINNIEAFENISESTDFINDLNINSANLVDIILDIEDVFKIEIDNLSMEKMLTMQATIEIIELKLSDK